MANPRRGALVWLGLLLAAFTATAGHGQERPLVVLFAARDNAAPSGISLSLLALRALRERLIAEGGLDVIIYRPEHVTQSRPDTAIFLRAVREHKLRFDPQNPTSTDRRALAAALGAVGVVVVDAERDKENSVVVEAQAMLVGEQKTWTERQRARFDQGNRPAGVSWDAPLPNDVLSAANTLALRLLGGVFAGHADRDGAAERAPATPLAVLPRDIGSETRTLLEQGTGFLTSGDTGGAIVVLRQAVNLAPRSATARVALTRAYLEAGREDDAVAEAKSALALVSTSNDPGKSELLHLLAQASARSGDTAAAEAAYEQILQANPRAHAARLARGDLWLAQNKITEAEAEYRAALQIRPTDPEIARRLAQVLASRNDPWATEQILSQLEPTPRCVVACALFDASASTLRAALAREQKAFADRKISREVFYNAARAQAGRAIDLREMLLDAPPVGGEPRIHAYKRRLLAASLLEQAASAMVSFLETGEVAAGSQAAVLLAEAQREITQAQIAEKTDQPERRAASNRETGAER